MFNGSLPSLNLSETGAWLGVARSLATAGALSAFGALVFLLTVAPAVFRSIPERPAWRLEGRLLALVRSSLCLSILASIGWLVIQAVAATAPQDWKAVLRFMPSFTWGTTFGHTVLARLAVYLAILFVLTGPSSRFRLWLAAALATVSILLQAGHSHAIAMGRGLTLLLASDIVHLLSAGAWLGGLLPLLLVVRSVPPGAAAAAALSFSIVGQLCVVGLAASAAYQGWILVGSAPGLVGSVYGWVVAAKAVIFFILLAMAVGNRFRFVPALLADDPATASKRLTRSIAVETALGLLVVCLAALLSGLEPPIHLQPVWPFDVQLSLANLEENPGLRTELGASLIALAFAALALALGVARKRFRWPSIALAVIVVGLAVPHLRWLVVKAYPTTFYRSPTDFDVTSIAGGAALYPQHCASCHGIEGRGDGPAAKALHIPPADLTAGHLWGHSDGEMFWWLSHGVDDSDGSLAMPGFDAILSEDQRWGLIDFVRAHNAGLVYAAQKSWSPPIKAPDFDVNCSGSVTTSLEELRGKVIRIEFGVGDTIATPAVTSVAGFQVETIMVPPDGGPISAGSACVAKEPAIWKAYATISGMTQAELKGSQFLIDPNGWLRASWRMGSPAPGIANWDDPSEFSSAVTQICTHPIGKSEGFHGHAHN